MILYELIAGLTPFHAEQLPQLCTRVFTGEPTPIGQFRSDVPAGLEAVLLRCFEKKRENRWRNVAELAAALVPFAPARAVVHAERAAAILGLNGGPSRMTDLLPPEPIAALPPLRAQAMSAGSGGTLDNGLVTRSRTGATVAPRWKVGTVVGAGLGLVVLAMVSVGVIRRNAGPADTPSLASTTATAITSSPLPESTLAIPQLLPSALIVSPPATSAFASGTVAAGSATAPKLPPRSPTPSPHPTATAKAGTPPPKRSILEKD